MQKHHVRLFLALITLIVAPKLAAADTFNLVQNGGFETGDFTGWTVAGQCQFVLNSIVSSGCSTVDTDPGASDGKFAAYLGAGSGGVLSQMLKTTTGGLYDVSFDLSNTSFKDAGGATPNQLTVMFGATTLLNLTDLAAFPYKQFVFSDLVGSSDGTALTFATDHGPAYFVLDDVAVTGTPTPEPASLSLIAMGVFGAAVRQRRKSVKLVA